MIVLFLQMFVQFFFMFFGYFVSFAVFIVTKETDPQFANQEKVYNDIGKQTLKHAFEG